MKKPENLKELREIAFSIPDMGMEIREKKCHNRELYEYTENRFLFQKRFYVQDDRMMFFINGNEYMVPYFDEAKKILLENGYEETYITPLFTKDEIPVDKEAAKRWKHLEEAVKEFKKVKKHHLFQFF